MSTVLPLHFCLFGAGQAVCTRPSKDDYTTKVHLMRRPHVCVRPQFSNPSYCIVLVHKWQDRVQNDIRTKMATSRVKTSVQIALIIASVMRHCNIFDVLVGVE